MNLELRCRCGDVRGSFDPAHGGGTRALCYCKDCQAYAHFLGHANRILDREGGSDIVACLPSSVRFTQGEDALICMSLSPRGLLRWHTRCCRTAIGNTPRDPRLSYLGLMRDCVPGDEGALGAAFGPARIRINTQSALAPVRATRLASLRGMAQILKRVLTARLGGDWRDTPFFDPTTSRPVRAPQVLTPVERRALEPALRNP